MVYEVYRAPISTLRADTSLEDSVWGGGTVGSVCSVMGSPPVHQPRTEFRLGYDDDGIAGVFRVQDRYVRAVAEKHQDPVWRDSCVELFFTPHDDPSRGYFNLEMNAGGKMLFRYQEQPRVSPVSVSDADLQSVYVATSMPERIEPEIVEPVEWRLAFRVPLGLIRRYCPRAVAPAAGVTWRANLQKCADGTSHPHWITWAPILVPEPDFHRPEHFGTLRFM